jgi:hypothetical protein
LDANTTIKIADALEIADDLVECNSEVDTAEVHLEATLVKDEDKDRIRLLKFEVKGADGLELAWPLLATQDQPSPEPVQTISRPAKQELKLSCTTTFETGTEKLTLEIKTSSRQSKIFDNTKKIWNWMKNLGVADKIKLADVLEFAEELVGDTEEVAARDAYVETTFLEDSDHMERLTVEVEEEKAED